MPDDPFDNLPFDSDPIAAALAHAAMAEGDAKTVTVLAVSTPRFAVIRYENRFGEILSYRDDQCTTFLAFYLEVPAQAFGQIYRVRGEVQAAIFTMLQPIIDSYPYYRVLEVCIVPAAKAPANWQDQALAWLRGEGVNNQGRVRSDNIAARQYDGLLFRTDEEINLYRAFKAQGVMFAPLPVFVQGGNRYKRIEPDFIVIKGGMVALIEVDGPIHQESPVEAQDRITMLVHEGAHPIRVRSSECSTLEGAEVCAKRVLATLAKVRAAR
jgi:hypothetical protein